MQNYWWKNLNGSDLGKHNNAQHLGLKPIVESPQNYHLELHGQQFKIDLTLIADTRICILKACMSQIAKMQVDSSPETQLSKVLLEVKDERTKQDAKWGQQNHSPMEWMAILMEEVGEASKEAVDFHFYYPPKFGEPNNIAELQSLRLRRYRKEMVQTAAVAVSMIESYDRNLGRMIGLLETNRSEQKIEKA